LTAGGLRSEALLLLRITSSSPLSPLVRSDMYLLHLLLRLLLRLLSVRGRGSPAHVREVLGVEEERRDGHRGWQQLQHIVLLHVQLHRDPLLGQQHMRVGAQAVGVHLRRRMVPAVPSHCVLLQPHMRRICVAYASASSIPAPMGVAMGGQLAYASHMRRIWYATWWCMVNKPRLAGQHSIYMRRICDPAHGPPNVQYQVAYATHMRPGNGGVWSTSQGLGASIAYICVAYATLRMDPQMCNSRSHMRRICDQEK